MRVYCLLLYINICQNEILHTRHSGNKFSFRWNGIVGPALSKIWMRNLTLEKFLSKKLCLEWNISIWIVYAVYIHRINIIMIIFLSVTNDVTYWKIKLFQLLYFLLRCCCWCSYSCSGGLMNIKGLRV